MSVRNLLQANKPIYLNYPAKLDKAISWYKDPVQCNFKFNCLIYELVALSGPTIPSELFNVLKTKRTPQNFITEFSLMDVIDHYLIAIRKDNEDYSEIVKFRDMLIEYDKDNLLTKKQKGYDTTNSYGNLMFSPNVLVFSSYFNHFIRILSTPELRKLVGDRLRYFKFNDPNTYKVLGIYPAAIADIILNHPYVKDIAFKGLKNPRQKIINYIKRDNFLVYNYDEEDSEIYDDQDTLFTAWQILNTGKDLSKTYTYIQAILVGVYFNDYSQWFNRIRIGSETCPRFTVHHHTLLQEMYSEDSPGIEDIDWSLHPTKNFAEIIDYFIEEQEELLKIKKPESIRKFVNIPNVKELVTAKELINVGESMNICIGGSHYINYLYCDKTHYYQIGDGKPTDQIIVEFKKNDDRWRLVQAVTVGNQSVSKEHLHYDAFTALKSVFDIEYPFCYTESYRTMSSNLQQAVIHHLSLIGKS